MPRISRGPHLYLKRRDGAAAIWYIRDGAKRISTGCGEGDDGGAQRALAEHIISSGKPVIKGDPAQVEVAAVMMLYLQDRVPLMARPKEAAARIDNLLDFFGRMLATALNPSRFAAYVRQRGAEQAARRELEDLRAALRYAWRCRMLVIEIPVTLPDKSQPRERWLTRSEAARLLLGAMGFRLVQCSDVKTRAVKWVAWDRRGERNPHAQRFILNGLYHGSRHRAILALGWHPHVQGGHADLDKKLIYRRGSGERETKKRRPPTPIPNRLLAHMRRWRRLDGAAARFVVSYDGSQMDRMQRAWRSARKLADLDESVTPHVLRHTFVTWQLQAGTDIWIVAGRAGMTPEQVERTYGHHHPDYLQSRKSAR